MNANVDAKMSGTQVASRNCKLSAPQDGEPPRKMASRKRAILVPTLVLAAIQLALASSGAANVVFKQEQAQAATQTQNQAQAPISQAANKTSKLNDKINLIEADQSGLYLVGLFDVHQSNARAPFRCGQVELDAGEWLPRRPMQNLQAFLWAIEQVNADKTLLPGVKLGSLVIDTCSSFLRTNQQLANLLHPHPHSQPAAELPGARQTVALVADNSDWQSVQAVVSMASSVGLTTFVTQSRSTKLTELARKYLPANQLDLSADLAAGPTGAEATSHRSEAQLQHQFEGFLGELLGIGKMTTPASPLDEAAAAAANVTAPEPLQGDKLEAQKLLMVRMLLGNELLAEAIGALAAQMNWDFLSIIYDDEPDMVDLHDELARQLFARNTQFALDEQVAAGSPAEVYDRLLQNLAKKSQAGARVVITLLSTGSARNLLESLRRLRGAARGGAEAWSEQQVKQVNSLLWITISDREPYYSFATDALGTIAISSSASLIPEFKTYYDKLAAGDEFALAAGNRWWPEYLRAIMAKHRREVELVANECAKWLEPAASPLREKCRSITLSSLVQSERKAQLQAEAPPSNRTRRLAGQPAPISGARRASAGKLKLDKYLAGGWEHNGMDVINAVLAAANGLESIRQTLCPESRQGICERMRELIHPSSPIQMLNERDLLPTISELVYSELLRSTFQLADGRMFNLNDFNSLGGQVEAKLKLYNLRYLQQNSIGFVKFGHYDQHDGLTVNVSKAKHYPANNYLGQQPIERLKSSCEDESRCLMLEALHQSAGGAGGQHNNGAGPMSEEELAAGVNSLFKLDHPWTAPAGNSSGSNKPSVNQQQQPQQQSQSQHHDGQQDSHVHTMRSPVGLAPDARRQLAEWRPFESEAEEQAKGSAASQAPARFSEPQASRPIERQTLSFDTIVLLALHNKGYQSSSAAKCSPARLDAGASFQHLAALAYAQTLVNGHHSPSAGRQQHIQLTTTVIDYCGAPELARRRLSARLQLADASRSVAVIDFDSSVGELVDGLVTGDANLLHLTIGGGTSGRPSANAASAANQHLRINLLPSKESEIEALVKLISSISAENWKLVHLIYTDSHHYRDEFVRRANEANICVSKLIWIPAPTTASEQQQQQQLDLDQLDKTKRLFASELYDYYRTANDNSDYSAQGLNSTKILVVLASSNEQTNRIIHAAATDSMLDHYIWLTTHEWLNHIELPAELGQLGAANGGAMKPAPGSLTSPLPADRKQLPRHFLSTRLETLETQGFRKFFAHLTPAIHSPIPTEWFDEFWQQHFDCRLPFSSRAEQLANLNSSASKGKLCDAGQHLDLHQIIEDDRVHYTVRAIESIHLALDSMNFSQPDAGRVDAATLAAKFRQHFDNIAAAANNNSNKAPQEQQLQRRRQSPFGFDVVHRMLTDTGSGRRPNSRDLAPPAGLQTVGLWRKGELMLWRNLRESPRGANDAADDSEGDLEAAIAGSLGRLASVRSRCSAARTCDLCRQQIQQTIAAIKLEEQRLSQSDSVNEPRAVSSIGWHQLTGRKQAEQSVSESVLDSLASSSFDEPESEPEQELAKEGGGQSNSVDVIQASASSLFDPSTSKQIERQRQSDIRRAYNHMMQLNGQTKSTSFASAQPFQQQQASGGGGGNKSRLASGTLVSLLSLAGVICVVASMTYLYPSMLDRRGERQLLRSDSQSSIGSGLSRREGAKLQIMDSSSFSSSASSSLACFNDTNSLNDYFLLTGLLMLYSINIALLLPAAKSVCWFRRVGLASSYTVIFSSILIKVLAANWRRRRQDFCGHNFAPANSSCQPNQQQQQQQQKQFDPIEESVEVTFESLPHDTQLGSDLAAQNPQQQQQQQQNCSTVSRNVNANSNNQLSNGYQTSVDNRAPAITITRELPATQFRQFGALTKPMASKPMTTGVVLILGQMLVSVVWLARQPPEPTLYFGRWFCSSPIRSPVMFLYEPLISLLYPASILVFTWTCAILAYRRASKNDEQFKTVTRRLLSGNGARPVRHENFLTSMSTLNCWQINAQQEELHSRLRDAKSLIITTTLLVLTWSLITLKMISSSRRLIQSSGSMIMPGAAPSSSSSGPAMGQSDLISAQVDDLTLVYGNIISGTIIFLFLFVYRFRLFAYAMFHKRSVKQLFRSPRHHGQAKRAASTGGQHRAFAQATERGLYAGHRADVLKYNLPSHAQASSRPAPSETHQSELTLFSQSQLNKAREVNRQQERVKLQQFNSSYGTYSQSNADATDAASSSENSARKPPAPDAIAIGRKSKKKSKRKQPAPDALHLDGHKLQRRQSAGSLASSTTRLVGANGSGANFLDADNLDDDDDDVLDTISYSSSTTSCQLQGNDLYPIDCSLQLDAQLPVAAPDNNDSASPARSGSFGRRPSLRRSASQKLDLIREVNGPESYLEQAASGLNAVGQL